MTLLTGDDIRVVEDALMFLRFRCCGHGSPVSAASKSQKHQKSIGVYSKSVISSSATYFFYEFAARIKKENARAETKMRTTKNCLRGTGVSYENVTRAPIFFF